MTSCWSASHVFLAQLDRQTYRCSAILDDAAFERLMDMLHWKMPYQLRVFHCSDLKWVEENPVLKAVPSLLADINSLRAAGFQPAGVTQVSAGGWNSPSCPRITDQYPAGEKVRWVLYKKVRSYLK